MESHSARKPSGRFTSEFLDSWIMSSERRPRIRLTKGWSGGAFALDRPIAAFATVQVDDWHAVFNPGLDMFVVETDAQVEDASRKAAEVAEKVLDTLAVNGVGGYRIRDRYDEVVTWRPAGAGLRVEAAGLLERNIPLPMSLQRTDVPTGSAPSRTKAAWSPALRFFRMAQTDRDAWSAFRNTYLACEYLLAEHTPQIGPSKNSRGESDRDWIERALRQFDATRPQVNGKSWLSELELDEFAGTVYKGTRHAIFHAKHGKDLLLPLDDVSNERVHKALVPLTRLFLELVAEKQSWPLNERPQDEHELMRSGTWLMPLGIVPFQLPEQPGDNDMLALRTPLRETVPDESGRVTETFAALELQPLEFIDGWVITSGGSEIARETLRARLPVADFSELRIHVRPRMTVTTIIKTSYPA